MLDTSYFSLISFAERFLEGRKQWQMLLGGVRLRGWRFASFGLEPAPISYTLGPQEGTLLQGRQSCSEGPIPARARGGQWLADPEDRRSGTGSRATMAGPS